MRLTVAICTRNRAHLLERTLHAMRGLRIPAAIEWELVVVDNGSADATPRILASANDLPLRAVREDRAGLSHARNRAVAAASGEYTLWTDDDVLVGEHWLDAYAEAFTRWPRAVLFGGPVAPEFVDPPPAWLARVLPRVGGAYALVDLGPEPVTLQVEGWRMPFGANYAVRMDAQRRVPYDPQLGRSPEHPGMVGEETAVSEALLRDGGEGRWVPGARVRHVIPAERQTVGYLRRQIAGHEEFRYRERIAQGEAPAVSPAGVLLRACAAELRLAVRRVLSSPERWIEELAVAGEQWGRLRAIRRTGGLRTGKEDTATGP